jgi:hypothetical protein
MKALGVAITLLMLATVIASVIGVLHAWMVKQYEESAARREWMERVYWGGMRRKP